MTISLHLSTDNRAPAYPDPNRANRPRCPATIAVTTRSPGSVRNLRRFPSSAGQSQLHPAGSKTPLLQPMQ